MFEDVKLGPCSLSYGDLNIDLTTGGVTLSVQPMLLDVKVDQFGQGPVDHRVVGWNIKATVPLAQTDYASLKAVAVFLEESGTGLQDTKLGTSLRNLAKQLTLHPLEVPDTSEDVILYLAAPITAMELKYGYDDTRIYNVEFAAYPKDGADPADAGNWINIGGSELLAKYAVTFTATATAVPVPGAVVKLAGMTYSRVTNAEGEAVFYLPDGEYVYAVEHPMYSSAMDAFEVDGETVDIPVALV